MAGKAMSREQLSAEVEAAIEGVIQAAQDAAARGVMRKGEAFGPREALAHLAGWEAMAIVRVPRVAGGMAPLEFEDETQNDVMNEAINGAFVAMIGDQSLDEVCGILRRASQADIAMLRTLDDKHFQPGEYVYERTLGVVEHCQEHADDLARAQP